MIRVTKSRRMRWAGHVALTGRRGMHMILVRKPEGKIPLRRYRHRRIILRRIIDRVGWYGLD
jgi:hypothetical protein